MVLLCCGTTVMADEPDEQLSTESSSNKTLTMDITEDIDVSYTWSIPAYLDFSDGIADLTIEIREAHIRTDTKLDIKLSSFENHLKDIDNQEQVGSSLRIINKNNEEINEGQIILTAFSYTGDDPKAAEEVKTTLSVILDRPSFLLIGKYKGNITFEALLSVKDNS